MKHTEFKILIACLLCSPWNVYPQCFSSPAEDSILDGFSGTGSFSGIVTVDSDAFSEGFSGVIIWGFLGSAISVKEIGFFGAGLFGSLPPLTRFRK